MGRYVEFLKKPGLFSLLDPLLQKGPNKHLYKDNLKTLDILIINSIKKIQTTENKLFTIIVVKNSIIH